jgi:membrane-associated phospholipid phosphatase
MIGARWRRWLVIALAVLVVVAVCIRYIDPPLAHLAARLHFIQAILAAAPVGLPVLDTLSALAVLLGAGYLATGKPLPKWLTAAMLAGLALVCSVCLIEFVLKPVFGRAVPPLYLRYGDYGFHWFHRSVEFGAFPSGHADQAMSIVAVLWVYYPRWRWVYVGAFLLLAGALIVGEWHYLSDIVAGGFIGTVAGVLMMHIWRAYGKNPD